MTLALLAGLLGWSCSTYAMHDQDNAFSSAQWTETMTHVDYDGKALETVVSKIWIKGDRQRIEKLRNNAGGADGKAISAVILHGHDKYTLKAGADKLIKTSLQAESVLYDKKWFKKINEQKTGVETIDGKTCDVYTFDSEHNLGGLLTIRSTVRECRWRGLSLKTVARMPTPPDGSGDAYITVLKDVQVDIPIADDLFKLPDGLPVEEKTLPTEGVESPAQ